MRSSKIISNTISESISVSRSILCILVVFIHARNMDGHVEPISDWVLHTMHVWSEVLCGVAVPAFMFISAYLLTLKYVNEGSICNTYLNVLRKKIKGLVIPYILWNLIAFVWLLLRHYVKADDSIFLPNLWQIFTITPMANGTSLYPADGPLWFIRDLILLNVVTPVFILLGKSLKRIFALVVASVFIFKLCPDIVTFSRSVPPFLVGVSVALLNGERFLGNKIAQKSILIIWSVCVFTLVYVSWSNLNVPYLYSFFLLVSFGVVFLIGSYLPVKAKLFFSFLSKHSFFIYAAHIFIIGYVYKILLMFFFNILNYDFSVFFAYLLSPIVSIMICVGIDILLLKKIGRIRSFLVGGR